MDTRVAAVALSAIMVPLVALMFRTPVAGRIARSCRDALLATGAIAVLLDVGMIAAAHADPFSGSLLFIRGATVLAATSGQRRGLHRYLAAIQAQLSRTHPRRPSGR